MPCGKWNPSGWTRRQVNRREINVCVRQAEANSVVKAVLDARFGGVRSGVAEAEFLFQRAQTKAVAVMEIASPPIGALISALKENDPNERKEATEGLGNIGYDRAVPALIAALPNETTRDEAAEVLVRIGKPAVPALIAVLNDPQWKVREQTAKALGKIGDKSAVPAMIAALNNDRSSMKERPAAFLGKVIHSAVPAMIAALNNVRSSMKERLAAFLGKVDNLDVRNNLDVHGFYGEDSEFHKAFGAFRGLDGPSPSVSI